MTDASPTQPNGFSSHAEHFGVPDDDVTGRTFGEYRLLRRLGRGGMATVYLAEQTSLGRNVAIKVLQSNSISGSVDVLRKRFEQEARAAAVLNHPGIVQVYSIGVEHDVHYIVQEFVPGRNLSESLRRDGPVDVPTCLRIMGQVASALKVAADAGIVHRDIKPENIMITTDGDAKVADFGLAQWTDSTRDLNLTQVGVTVGTPLYMSPEQINGTTLDARSDIYSLGVTCYQMLAGRPPFHGETAMSVAVQHLKEEPPPLNVRRIDVPPELAALIHRMMAKLPGDRPQSLDEVVSTIQTVEQRVQTGSDSAPSASIVKRQTRVRRITARLARGIGSSRTVWFAGSMLAMFLLSAGMGVVLRPSNPLDVARSSDANAFPREPSATRQFAVAMTAGMNEADRRSPSDSIGTNEAAWRAVIEHYPDSLEAKRAVLQLAYLYLDAGRFREARLQFDQLVQFGVDDQSLQAQGFAGRAIVASLTGDASGSKAIIETELRGRIDLLNPSLAARLTSIQADNERLLRDAGQPASD